MWVTLKTTHKLLILNLGMIDYLETTTVCKQAMYRLTNNKYCYPLRYGYSNAVGKGVEL